MLLTSNNLCLPYLENPIDATAPGVALFLETPTELKRVCVVKTPIASSKKCCIEQDGNQYGIN